MNTTPVAGSQAHGGTPQDGLAAGPGVAPHGTGEPSAGGPLPLSKAEIERADRKPLVPRVRVEAIPAELHRYGQWVAWDYERRPDKKGGHKWTKVPVNARDWHLPQRGRNASSRLPFTWTVLTLAWLYYEDPAHEAAGIGFMFSLDDPFTGVDLDDSIDPATGTLRDWARPMVEDLASYTEVSPSGTGVKIIVRGKVPGLRRRSGKVEMYDSFRFFTLTGDRLPGTPPGIAPRQEALGRLYAGVFGEDAAKEKAAAPPAPPRPLSTTRVDGTSLSDAEVAGRA
jgi:primase-polymerase (primpol)-like protein